MRTFWANGILRDAMTDVQGAGSAPQAEVATDAPAAPETMGDATGAAPPTEGQPAPSKHDDDQRQIGAMGTELGNSRDLLAQQNARMRTLEQTIQQMQAERQAANAPPPEPGFDEQLNSIMAQAESGDLSFEEAVGRVGKLSYESGLSGARREFEKLMGQRERETAIKAQQDSWLKEHPDFFELRDSGVLDALIRENPLHDHFSAYLEHHIRQARNQQSLIQAQAQQAAEMGKQQGRLEGKAISQAARQMDAVGSGQGPGSPPDRPMSQNELDDHLASMLEEG